MARADDDANRAALEAWVEARDTELRVARTGVDTLAGAIDHLAQMRTLLQQRHTLMNEPESMEQPRLLRQVIADTATARSAKNEIEERLSGLRSMQLAQARRLREADLSDELRSALTVRSDALERVEVYGRERLETQDALIALLEGMRCQLEAQLEEHNLSVQMMQAQEALQKWWDAELIVIDDQSIRVRELVSALTMFVLVVLLVSLVRMTARRALKRRKARDECIETGDVRLALSAIAGNTSHIFVLIAAFYVAMVFSGLASPTVREWLWTALVVAFYAQLGIWANAAMVDYFNRRRTRQEMRDPSMVTGYGVMMFFIRVGIWITVIVSLLAYFKYPIAGLVGALGVSSVAVAFAVQSILGDVFSSMAIVLDKPFRVGDFIKAGDTLGVKTTRIRSLSGEQVVMSNSDLLGSRIHNFKQQGINLGIHRRFEEAGISFAYPTQELILRRAAGPAHA